MVWPRHQPSAVIAAVFLSVWPGSMRASQQPVPQPFPRPAAPANQTPTAPSPPRQPAPAAPSAAAAPTEATLGLPIYPGAQFIASYDAGRGQRYYLFGASGSFTDMVNYYRTTLKQKGELVFEAPATHMFEVGKFREETMAFPPGVTIKDYTWGGSAGYLNPKPGGQPSRFPTIIQFVAVSQDDR